MEKPLNTCIVDTTYTLSLYLLYVAEADIQRTVFFVGNAIPESISSKLTNVIRIDNSKNKYGRKVDVFMRRIESLFRWRFRFNTIMYAQDHLAFSAHLIGHHSYVLLEDAPNIYTNYKNISFMRPDFASSLYKRLGRYILLGPIGKCKLGTNSQCIDRLVTSERDLQSDILKGRKTTLLNLTELWNKSSDDKKKYIMDVFGIEDLVMRQSMSCSTILFSQPLMEDCGLSEQEMKEIYAPYISQYSAEGVVIKPHPRDKFDYFKHFPQVMILDCKAPMQLLSAMGMNFKRAITVCSSAVSSMSDDTEIVWIGSKVNDKVLSVYGDLKCPR